MDGNRVRAKISDEARGRLEFYRSAYRHALQSKDPYKVNYYSGMIYGYTDALAGLKVITDEERLAVSSYYMDMVKGV